MSVKWYLVVLIHMSLITNDAEHLFMYFLALVCIFFGEMSIQVFCPFYLGHLSFLIYYFIYFCLCQFFVAVRGLSLVAASWATLECSA